MDEKVTVGGLEIPRSDWEATPESVKELVRQLVDRLTAIEERLGLNSSNSSIPPSKQGKARKTEKKESSGKRGGQKGHKGFGRNLYETSECSEVHEHRPSQCQHCGEELDGRDPSPYRHQIVELPEVEVVVHEHQLHRLRCETCGRETRAKFPEGVETSGYGARLQSVVASLSGEYHLSHTKVQRLVAEAWGVKLSRGSINRIRERVCQKLAGVVEQAKAYVQASESVHVDETRWMQQNSDGKNPENSSAWLWAAVSGAVAVYQIRLSRSSQVAKELLGELYRGIVHSDRYAGYNWLPVEQRQVCWAHLKRDFTRMAERSGVSGEIGRALLAQTKQLFHWWHRVRDGTISFELFEPTICELRDEVHRLLTEAVGWLDSPREKTPLAKTARTCQQILKLEPALWRFSQVEGSEPTNNTAERAVRGAVIWRGLSFGSQSQAGSEFVERLLTFSGSLRLQGRSSMQGLTSLLRGQPFSLLPAPTP